MTLAAVNSVPRISQRQTDSCAKPFEEGGGGGGGGGGTSPAGRALAVLFCIK